MANYDTVAKLGFLVLRPLGRAPAEEARVPHPAVLDAFKTKEENWQVIPSVTAKVSPFGRERAYFESLFVQDSLESRHVAFLSRHCPAGGGAV